MIDLNASSVVCWAFFISESKRLEMFNGLNKVADGLFAIRSLLSDLLS